MVLVRFHPSRSLEQDEVSLCAAMLSPFWCLPWTRTIPCLLHDPLPTSHIHHQVRTVGRLASRGFLYLGPTRSRFVSTSFKANLFRQSSSHSAQRSILCSALLASRQSSRTIVHERSAQSPLDKGTNSETRPINSLRYLWPLRPVDHLTPSEGRCIRLLD